MYWDIIPRCAQSGLMDNYGLHSFSGATNGGSHLFSNWNPLFVSEIIWQIGTVIISHLPIRQESYDIYVKNTFLVFEPAARAKTEGRRLRAASCPAKWRVHTLGSVVPVATMRRTSQMTDAEAWFGTVVQVETSKFLEKTLGSWRKTNKITGTTI